MKISTLDNVHGRSLFDITLEPKTLYEVEVAWSNSEGTSSGWEICLLNSGNTRVPSGLGLGGCLISIRNATTLDTTDTILKNKFIPFIRRAVIISTKLSEVGFANPNIQALTVEPTLSDFSSAMELTRLTDDIQMLISHVEINGVGSLEQFNWIPKTSYLDKNSSKSIKKVFKHLCLYNHNIANILDYLRDCALQQHLNK